NGVIESINPKSETIFGPLLIGQSRISSLLSEEGLSRIDLENHEGEALLHLELLNSSGKAFPGQVVISSFFDRGEKKFIMAVRDLSTQREVEQLKREFIRVVSDDISTPLVSINQNLTFLKSNTGVKRNQKATRYAAMALNECERLMRLTRDLLDLTKLESGRLMVEAAVHPVDELISTALYSVRTSAERQRVRLEHDRAAHAVFADAGKTVQILVNFLDDAIQSTPPGKSIRVKAKAQGSYVEIDVSDECGLPKDKLSDIFGRVKPVIKADRSKRGSGLGLAICHRLAQCQDGSVGVESRDATGSTFWLRLPASAPDVVSRISPGGRSK
ncbi:MAG: PAS domain-containing sensor histidine kinase, partial [Cyanobacteria bacterium]|nr:PAS domain-containing sensor histidine kinase [Cyanobacteriota bacterium]